MKPLMLTLNAAALRKAVDIVEKGGLIIYPTDTVYGLGSDPFSKGATEKIYDVKGRGGKPVPILVSNLDRARRIAVFTPDALRIAGKFWPGPLTIVLKKKRIIPAFLGGHPWKVGLRLPDHPLTVKLIEMCGGYLTGTSANISGNLPPVTALEALRQLGGKVALILDGGETSLKASSTVIDISVGKLKILREGTITEKEIIEAIGAT